MIVGQDVLREQLLRALEEADRRKDTLIAALLSQCLAVIDDRDEPIH